MCSVVGYHNLGPGLTSQEHVEALCELFWQSKIRGLHAFGVTYRQYYRQELVTRKFHSIDELTEFLRSAMPTVQSLIGHCRYSTSGDWQEHRNNQLIHVGKSAMVFNGVISMATREEYQKTYGREYETDNDGEIFLRKMMDGEDWLTWINEAKFSFAGMAFDGRSVWALRNKSRPLWATAEPGAVFIASTADIFKRAKLWGRSFELQPGMAYDLTSFELWPELK